MLDHREMLIGQIEEHIPLLKDISGCTGINKSF